jgi:hypothetical protein
MSKPKNDWQARFGAKRRAIDRAVLAEAERQISSDFIKPHQEPIDFENETARRIARAFGRPLDGGLH